MQFVVGSCDPQSSFCCFCQGSGSCQFAIAEWTTVSPYLLIDLRDYFILIYARPDGLLAFGISVRELYLYCLVNGRMPVIQGFAHRMASVYCGGYACTYLLAVRLVFGKLAYGHLDYQYPMFRGYALQLQMSRHS